MGTDLRTLVPDAGSPWKTCPSSQTFQRVAAPAGGFGQLVMRIVVRTRMLMMVDFGHGQDGNGQDGNGHDALQPPVCHLLWRLHNQLSCLCNW